MAIEITEILGSDSIAQSRIVLNQNFNILKNSINSISDYVNIADRTITGIQKLTVKKGETNITETLIDTNGSGSFGGNISVTGNITVNSLLTSNGVNVSGGNISLNSSTSKIINKGNLELDGELVLTDFNSSSIDASNELTFIPSQSVNNLIYSGNTAIAGKVDLTGRSVVTLAWTNFVNTSDSQYYLHRIKLETPNTAIVGQRVLIIARINEDVTLPHYLSEPTGYWIVEDTLSFTTGNPITTGIKFTATGQSCELIFDGLNWLILNVYGAVVV